MTASAHAFPVGSLVRMRIPHQPSLHGRIARMLGYDGNKLRISNKDPETGARFWACDFRLSPGSVDLVAVPTHEDDDDLQPMIPA